jgi:large subunit ribosomal protein L6
MSRVAKTPVVIPAGVEVSYQDKVLTIKSSKGSLTQEIHKTVEISTDDGKVTFEPLKDSAWPMAGTMRSLVNNMVIGLTDGYVKKLQLVGVGYRAKAQGNKLDLSLGFSHPVVFEAPEGIKLETPTNTEVIISGVNKQEVGQAAAKIRAYRPPEPYKGKGVRYADERVIRKEAKKK